MDETLFISYSSLSPNYVNVEGMHRYASMLPVEEALSFSGKSINAEGSDSAVQTTAYYIIFEQQSIRSSRSGWWCTAHHVGVTRPNRSG